MEFDEVLEPAPMRLAAAPAAPRTATSTKPKRPTRPMTSIDLTGAARPDAGSRRQDGGEPSMSHLASEPRAALSGGRSLERTPAPTPRQQPALQSLGRIPIISSGATGRLPSAYLPSTSSTSAAPRPQPDAPRTVHKGKARATLDLTGPETSEVMDLTTSDAEDDVVIVSGNDPICIGQLTSLALILYCVPELQPPPDTGNRHIDANGRPLPAGALSSLPVHIYRAIKQGTNETLKLLTPGGSPDVFGVMEHKHANVLGPLLGDGYSGTGVQVEAKGKVWCDAAVMRRPEKNPMMLPLVLLLYALPHNVEFVANTLDAAGIYLEHPVSYYPADHSGYRYSNPHNPAPGVSGRGDAERRRVQLHNSMHGVGSSYSARPPKTIELQRDQVKEVFQNLTSGVDLEEHEPHPMITTLLYPHQKQALSFLLDRETLDPAPAAPPGQEQPVVSLWRRRVNVYGESLGWTNVVTELEITGEATPPQARGSILADDMGCGKTVVVIALVAETLGEAAEWAKLPPQKDRVDSRFEEIVLDKSKKKVTVADIVTPIYGIDPTLASIGGFQTPIPSERPISKAASKKKQAKDKRERQRGDAFALRFERLVVRSRATLIICPLSTVQNWESQIEEHVGRQGERVYQVAAGEGEDAKEDIKGKGKAPASLSVYVYHGNARTTDALELAKYDVVITTFSTLGTEFSKQGRAEDEREEMAAAAVDSDDGLQIVNRDGSIVQRLKEEEEDTKKRKRKRIDGTGASPLQQVQWFRVVLDEAHIIKEHTTIQARAACELSASRRTALSGTPLQNSLNDLYSLVRFLRLEPFTDRAIWTQHIGALAKSGNPLGVSRLQLIMRHLALRRTKQSKDKDGKPILDLPPNNLHLVTLEFGAAEHAFYSSHHTRYKHDFQKLVDTDTVMKNYCSILQELLRLRQICVHSALVRDAEDAVAGDVDKHIEAHGISKSRAIQLLGLMRDAGGVFCSGCETELVSGGVANLDERAEVEERKPAGKSRRTTKSSTASAVCSEEESSTSPTQVLVITRCKHVFCQPCFQQKVCKNWPKHVKAGDRAECSACQTEITLAIDAVQVGVDELARALVDAADGDLGTSKKAKKARVFEHSTKTVALITDLYPFSQANPASTNFWGNKTEADETHTTFGFQPAKGEVVKSVVFSQWTKLLDRAGDALEHSHIKFGRLDGSMNRDQRTKAMDDFRLNPSIEVLLVSLRAGGVGLNLTAARRVYIMEPFWNPAVEAQAVDRCHRLGQTKEVATIRFVIKATIEESILKLQKRKTDLANMSLGQTMSKAELRKQRLEDMNLLLNP